MLAVNPQQDRSKTSHRLRGALTAIAPVSNASIATQPTNHHGLLSRHTVLHKACLNDQEDPLFF